MEATDDGHLNLNGVKIHIFNSRDPADLDWRSVGAEYVIDSTGKFNTLEKCQPHLVIFQFKNYNSVSFLRTMAPRKS